jgi:hypothetical protein
MKKICVALSLSLAVILVLAGCASSSVSSNRPGWVDQGTGFFSGDRGKAFFGVGAASGIKDVSMRRTTAEADARAALARSFRSKIVDLVKIYRRHVVGGDAGKVSEEQLAQQATRAFTEMELVGVPVVSFYFEPSENTQYALVMMNAASLKDQISQMKELSKEIREAIIKNSDDAFKELEEERQKNKQ